MTARTKKRDGAGGGQKLSKKWVTSFTDGPLKTYICRHKFPFPTFLTSCSSRVVSLSLTSSLLNDVNYGCTFADSNKIHIVTHTLPSGQ